MSNFVIKPVLELNTDRPVFKLERDGKCFYDEFLCKISEDANLEAELSDLDSIVEDAVNGKSLPRGKFRVLQGTKNKIYEAKSKHLRLYLLHENNTGKIIILGGKKGTQGKDMERADGIATEFKAYQQRTPKRLN